MSGQIKHGEGNLRKEKALQDDAKPGYERNIVERCIRKNHPLRLAS